MKYKVLCVLSLTALLSACGSSGGGSSGGSDGPVVTTTPVPATGQTTIYVDYDDGYYKTNHPMSFTDNGDGTIKDNVTGLLWRKSPFTDRYNWYQATGTYDHVYNASTTNVCSGIGAGWRLPTRFELLTITNYYNHFHIDTAYFPNNSWNYLPYWTSSVSPDGKAWNVEIQLTPDFYGPRSYSNVKDSLNNVRCVSGNVFAPGTALQDQGNGTVIDQTTNLMWQKCSAGQDTSCTTTGDPLYAWTNAVSYCHSLPLGGYSDWRLPNIKELASIADLTKSDPAINPSYFPGTYAGNYWSSTTDADLSGAGAWFIGSSGYVALGPKTYPYNVRCVRGQ